MPHQRRPLIDESIRLDKRLYYFSLLQRPFDKTVKNYPVKELPIIQVIITKFGINKY